MAGADSSGPLRLSRRWRFFAGIAVAPFLVFLAATGALYLLTPNIENVLYPKMMRVDM